MQHISTTEQVHTVYALIDPRTQFVRYIGVTGQSLQERLRGHLKDSRAHPNTRRARWIKQLGKFNLHPHIFPLEQTADRTRERQWIASFRSMGFDLTNLTDGGEGVSGLQLSEDAKRRISQAVTQRWQSPEYREHMRQAHIGQTPTPEHREKLSNASRGRKHTEATKQKMSCPKTSVHRKNAAEALARVRASGQYKWAVGDKNGMRACPDSTLKGARNPAAKMNEDKVREMRRRYQAGDGSTVSLAKEFGISQAVAWNIINNNTWKHVE